MNSKTLFSLLLFCLAFSFSALAQKSPVGLWKTIDDATGDAKSHIEIYEQDGKYYGKVTKLLLKPADTLCEKCNGAKKNKPVVSMVILEGLKSYKDYWSYGRILDPENGKTYKCSIWMEGNDKLKVRGYVGISALGRSQNWQRVN